MGLSKKYKTREKSAKINKTQELGLINGKRIGLSYKHKYTDFTEDILEEDEL